MPAIVFIFTAALCLTPLPTHADPQPARVVKHPSSPCVVHATAGEYPRYSVSKEGRTIYAPQSDGIVQAVFSPSGSTIALVGSEVDWVDLPSGERHSVALLQCESEDVTGYTNGYPLGDFTWLSDREFHYTDTATETKIRDTF